MSDEDTSGDPPKLPAAWETFIAQLTSAFPPILSEKRSALDTSPTATEQARYVHAIMAVAELLYTLGERNLFERFHFLAEAFQDISDGIPHPLFQIETRAGRPGRRPDISAIWQIRANICVGLEFMAAGGMDADKVIAQIWKQHRKELKQLGRANADIRASLRNWRKKFANEEITNEFALDAYREGIAQLNLARADYSGEKLIQVGERHIATALRRLARLSAISAR
jgi:hypothetical protein